MMLTPIYKTTIDFSYNPPDIFRLDERNVLKCNVTFEEPKDHLLELEELFDI